MKTMRSKDRLSGLFILLFSGVTIFLASRVPMGHSSKPGPGLFPLLMSLITGLLAFLILLRSRKPEKVAPAAPQEEASNKWAVFYLLGDLCLYALLFRPLGFMISTFVFLIALNPILKKKWIPVILGSMLISLAFFLFFAYLLKVELPMGIVAR